MGSLQLPKGCRQYPLRERSWGNEYITLNLPTLSSSIQTVEGLHVVSRRPRRLRDERVAGDLLETVSSDTHRLNVAEADVDPRVVDELLDVSLLLLGGGPPVDPNHTVLLQSPLQDVEHLVVPPKEDKLVLTAVDQHLHVVGHLGREGYAHHPTYHCNVSKDLCVSTLQMLWINMQQTLSREGFLDGTRFVKLDDVIHR